MIAASTGALLTSLLVTPFDVIKTRLQTQQSGTSSLQRYSGTVDAFREIVRSEGLSRLWRGLQPTLVMSVPSTVFYYAAYEQFRSALTKYCDMDASAPLVAGSVARVVVAATVAPLELLRTNLQAQGSIINGSIVQYRGIGEVFRQLYSIQGTRGLFSGLWPTLLRDVPFSGIYWGLYEQIRRGCVRVIDPEVLKAHPGFTTFSTNFVAGASAGMAAAVLTTPVDVIKTQMQVQSGLATDAVRPGAVQTFKQLAREGGAGAFMRGVVPRAAKVAPACAIMISVYELMKSVMLERTLEL